MHIDVLRQSRACVVIGYTNYRGERSGRLVYPRRATHRFEEVSWHPGQQWIFDAFDVGKCANRTFAMKDIHSWRPAADEDFGRLAPSGEAS